MERSVSQILERADASARERGPTARELLGQLVAERSLEGDPAIERCFDLVLERVGYLAHEVLRPVEDGLSSLILRFGAGHASRRIAFSGHVDVVPVHDAWSVPPFALTEHEGELYGRGTCDMKGGVAAFTAALLALADAGLLDECAIELVLTGEEEVGSRRGMIWLLEKGLITAPQAVCGEPTGLDVF